MSNTPYSVTTAGRLDSFVATTGITHSRAKAQDYITQGIVRVNGKVVRKCSYALEVGDAVVITGDLPLPSTDFQPIDLHLEVLYEDPTCLVVNKPVGLVVHPGSGMEPGDITLLHGIAHLFTERSLPYSMQMPLVHRLDKDTTGCLLVAKDQASHALLQQQFEHRTVSKTYLALVAGQPPLTEATIDSPIGRSTTNRTRMSVRGAVKLREAQTTYRIVESTGDVSLVECDLHTGRTHQIRVHLHAIGHPVLGDPTYHMPRSLHLSERFDVGTICLHAWRLQFVSPHDQKEHSILAPLPAAFAAALKRAGIEAKR